MALSAGTTLGPYSVTAKIGEGMVRVTQTFVDQTLWPEFQQLQLGKTMLKLRSGK